ncbi:glycosyltransferase [Pontibacter sp. 172403-2]|uniref:glycosyltransferase n=1 Tax=Pontibacter rufus TaxID=2791028 RepID=UPI0018AF77CD|nr:glycosyltransferase [Pontibacter sp. 172403-2]MBF9254970.1 glycosyltransferase [Pontibacter sp. 172403-2]
MRDHRKAVVLIPHYNDPEGLQKTIASFSENEPCDVLVVDDGSIAPIDENKIQELFKATGEVFFLYLEQNSGIETALNKGLDWIKENDYQFIARLDCGDINMPQRIHKQLEFMENNADIQLLGTWAEAIDVNGNPLYQLHLPAAHEDIEKKMFLNNMFIHPTVMFRKEALDVIKEYPYDYPAAEDYAFFFKFVRNFKTANLPEVLVRFEINTAGGISSTRRSTQLQTRIKIIKENFKFGYYPIMGITRASILLFIPRNIVESLKKRILWKGK